MKAHSPNTRKRGRPTGTGKFREDTKVMRIPMGLVESVSTSLNSYSRAKLAKSDQNVQLVDCALVDVPRRSFPFFTSPFPQAGFPSPAADYVQEGIDLNELLVTNPPATFFARIAGDSLIDRGLLDRDIVAVDRSMTPTKGKVVVAVYEGSIYIKVLKELNGRQALCSENQARAEEFPPMFLDEDPDHLIWGVVTSVVRQL